MEFQEFGENVETIKNLGTILDELHARLSFKFWLNVITRRFGGHT